MNNKFNECGFIDTMQKIGALTWAPTASIINGILPPSIAILICVSRLKIV